MGAPSLLLWALLVAAILPDLVHPRQLMEEDRLREYKKRNHTWPHYVPNTEGWGKLWEHRYRQIAEIEDRDKRYIAYVQTVNSAFLVPNFTEHGFGLARAPEPLMQELRAGIQQGLEKGPRKEEVSGVIEGAEAPWWIDREDLTQKVLEELQHYSETWAGMELTPFRAYGFRLYRNNSRLHMHLDKCDTHVVSFILHIASSEDSEPWPIVIEDYHGRYHEVVLKSGDILFYESAKLFHGRPHRFNGSWYSSVFVHYYPKHGWRTGIDREQEKHYAVPPGWTAKPTHHFETPIELVGAALHEPKCPNGWCQTDHTVKWSGPGEYGYLINPDGGKVPFDPKPIGCVDLVKQCEMWASLESDECKNNPDYMLTHCRKACGVCTPSADPKTEL